MEEKLKVGIITSTHGIKGEVKVFPTTDDAKRFKKLKEVMPGDEDNGTALPVLLIEGVKFFKQFAILKFKGIDSINEADKYKGKSLWIYRKDAVRLHKNEYFVADLIGMAVTDEEGKPLGVLTDVLETGANDVYVVNRGEEKDLLLPAIKECIIAVDVEQHKMTVHIIDGLLD